MKWTLIEPSLTPLLWYFIMLLRIGLPLFPDNILASHFRYEDSFEVNQLRLGSHFDDPSTHCLCIILFKWSLSRVKLVLYWQRKPSFLYNQQLNLILKNAGFVWSKFSSVLNPKCFLSLNNLAGHKFTYEVRHGGCKSSGVVLKYFGHLICGLPSSVVYGSICFDWIA